MYICIYGADSYNVTSQSKHGVLESDYVVQEVLALLFCRRSVRVIEVIGQTRHEAFVGMFLVL